jgi:hypothetical protein
MVEAAVCLANEMVGGADRLREDSLAYAMMRRQFGKPIASFESMKHKRQADMLMEVELAKALRRTSRNSKPHPPRAATALGGRGAPTRARLEVGNSRSRNRWPDALLLARQQPRADRAARRLMLQNRSYRGRGRLASQFSALLLHVQKIWLSGRFHALWTVGPPLPLPFNTQSAGEFVLQAKA